MIALTRPTVRHDGDCVEIHVPMAFRHRSGRKRIMLPEDLAPNAEDNTRCPLKVAIARAFHWQKMIETGEVRSRSELARRVGLDQSYIARIMRLTSLAPDIVEAVLRGDEPKGLSLRSVREDLAVSWEEQRKHLCVL